ncbi:uncharacterized protein LOC131623751 [Vicia villosa]|uniref:uncharacterized protein LOC131623751 n=1 Tax=Vicia villosa TaxID=3911 RepID=UPI00273CD899|nr:uncharacterized protein LOC131623751 [Vicia villosa]
MEECNPTLKPAELRFKLSKDSDEDDVDPTQYKRIIGSLRYLFHTSPDLAYNIGYVFMLGGAPVTLSARKEPVVTPSLCEAKYIVSSLYACQAPWMVNFVEEITWKNHGAITMKIDSMSVINLDKNLIAHGRSKHIKMRFRYLGENVAKGKMNLEHY